MNMQKIGEVLFYSWILAQGSRKPLPTGQGILDRALKAVIAEGHFTDEFRELRFVQTRVGTRCPELGAIMSWAQAAEQTLDPNPSYSVTEPKPSERVAEIVLNELGIGVGLARQWGQALSAALENEQTQERQRHVA